MSSARDVFINCPFDSDFAPGFQALVFSVRACGFRARCAREMDDGTETRIDKLYRIIEDCRFGVHDLSRTELDKASGLPRFNMPLELGIFLGAKRYGGEQHRTRRCIIFDIEKYRYQKFVSDLAGMDVSAHSGDPRVMAEKTRDWLVTVSRRKSIPATAFLLDSFDRFFAAMPTLAHAADLQPDRILFADFERLVISWIKAGHGRNAALL